MPERPASGQPDPDPAPALPASPPTAASAGRTPQHFFQKEICPEKTSVHVDDQLFVPSERTCASPHPPGWLYLESGSREGMRVGP